MGGGNKIMSRRRKRRRERHVVMTEQHMEDVRDAARTRRHGGEGHVKTTHIPGYAVHHFDVIACRQGSIGWGVKVTRDFDDKEVITQYDGVLLTKKEADERLRMHGEAGCSHFAKWTIGHHVIDGLRTPVRGLGVASFINHSLVGKEMNVTFQSKVNGLFAVAKKAIKKGEWLAVDYRSTISTTFIRL